VDHQVAHSVYVFDPDRNYNEFYCDTVKDWRNVLQGEMELITSHWDPASAEPFTEGRYDTSPTLRYVESAPIHPYRITHAVLETAQLKAMTDFYTRIGGLHIVRADGDVVYLRPSLDAYPHALVLVRGDAPAYRHAAFELKDEAELDAALQRLNQAGHTVAGQTDLPWKRSFFMRDVDGLLSEWYVSRAAPIDLSRRGDTPLAWAV